MAGKSTPAVQAAVAERRSKMIDMRVAGISFDVIALKLGYSSRSAASKDFTRAMERNLAKERTSIEILIETEVRRLDQMLVSLQRGVEMGNTKSIDTALRVAERRAKLLGLDKASKVEIITIDAIDAEIARLEAEVGAPKKLDDGTISR